MIGIYIHIPFCKSKCPYCDFYSIKGDDKLKDKYVRAILKELKERKKDKADTLYIGGGTPSILKGEQLKKIVDTAKKHYELKNSEITIEANPNDLTKEKIKELKEAGINRLSIGMQSANEDELKFLKRAHTKEVVKKSIINAKEEGIKNISVDLMIGLKSQTIDKLKKSIEFIEELDVNHLSTYILKIEKGTYFYKNTPKLPNDDEVSKLYIETVKRLEDIGFKQYEISNFAKPGYKSKHNLKYWMQQSYIGCGVSAHSFVDNKRFYHGDKIKEYIKHTKNYIEGIENGGDKEEWLMLRLRLNNGITLKELKDKEFNVDKMANKINYLKKLGCIKEDKEKIKLTTNGMLIQNSIIVELLKI